mmetsp:Transcript_48959/g.116418  ORF Transcript_48959/g.116418 Transcript_48959/m.116418 type:complete len:107 (+) Transcript_48959:671-991(+)
MDWFTSEELGAKLLTFHETFEEFAHGKVALVKEAFMLDAPAETFHATMLPFLGCDALCHVEAFIHDLFTRERLERIDSLNLRFVCFWWMPDGWEEFSPANEWFACF